MEANNNRKTGAFLPPDVIKDQLAAADRIRLGYAARGRTGENAPGYYILTFGCHSTKRQKRQRRLLKNVQE